MGETNDKIVFSHLNTELVKMKSNFNVGDHMNWPTQ